MFRRLSWSPDGTGICCSNSNINNKSCASILSRDNLKTLANLVGHKTVVCCTAYNRDFFEHEGGYKIFTAVGDKRGYLTVWCNKVPKPIFKCQVSSKKLSITDLSWKKYTLVVSCLDGHVTAFKFGEDEMGRILTEEEREKVFEERYGVETNGTRGGVGNLDVMRLQAEVEKETPTAQQPSTHNKQKQKPVPSPVKTPADTLRLQVVSKKKGKKR
jgi:protein HIRA/HIR1